MKQHKIHPLRRKVFSNIKRRNNKIRAQAIRPKVLRCRECGTEPYIFSWFFGKYNWVLCRKCDMWFPVLIED